MAVTRRHIEDLAITPGKRHASLYDNSYIREVFNFQPSSRTALNAYGAPTGSTGDSNVIDLEHGGQIKTHVKGTQTLLAPLLDPTSPIGLDVAQDQTNGDGIEYVFGGVSGTDATNPLGMTVGGATAKTKFLKLRFSIEDVSGASPLLVGFRKAVAFQATASNYSDYAALNVKAGAIFTDTNLASGGVVSTDASTAWADGETHTLQVNVLPNGDVRFFVDGVRKQPAAQFTFAASTNIYPFFYFLNTVDVVGKIKFFEVEAGNLEDVDDFRIS